MVMAPLLVVKANCAFNSPGTVKTRKPIKAIHARGAMEYFIFIRSSFAFWCLFSWIDSFAHWISRKNCCGPVTGLVTVFWPAMTTGAGELVLQTTGETRLVVDCKVKPTALVDHDRTASVPEGMIVSCAGDENRFVGLVPASHS